MKRLTVSALLALLPLLAQARLNVVATLPDLGALAQEIGGDQIKVSSLASGTEDPHFVEPKPSFIRLLNQADALIEGGADLEVGWLPPLVNNARNAKIVPGGPGRILASQGVRLLEVPVGGVDRSQGDVHPFGNPHYLLDPGNCKIVAAQLAAAFSRLDAAHAATYQANLEKFEERLARKTVEWEKALAPFRHAKVLTYHKSFDYLLARFGLQLAGTIEPKPGIEPSPTHINGLIPQAKTAGVRLIIIEPGRPRRTPQRVAAAVGARLVVLPLMPGGHEQARDFFSWFDFLVSQLAQALKP